MTKFRIAFTIQAETMFHLMSRLLPIDDLSVSEMHEGTAHKSAPKLAARVHAALTKPKKKRRSRGIDLEHGINSIIVNHLSDGKPHRTQEMQPLTMTGGYSPNSVNSRLEELRKAGIVERVGNGTWKLVQKVRTSAA